MTDITVMNDTSKELTLRVLKFTDKDIPKKGILYDAKHTVHNIKPVTKFRIRDMPSDKPFFVKLWNNNVMLVTNLVEEEKDGKCSTNTT